MEAQYIMGAARRDQFPPEGLPEFAFLGRSPPVLNKRFDRQQQSSNTVESSLPAPAPGKQAEVTDG